MSIKDETITPEQAIEILWNKSNLRFKLDNNQKDLYDLYVNSKEKIIVWACSRQLGKSYTLCTIAIESCLKKPNMIVKFLAPTQKSVKTIIKPIMRQLLMDCPDEIRPEYKTQEGIYLFKNGSEIHVCGADGGRAETIRGSKSDVVLVDECGFINDLEYIVQSVLIPTTTMTKGKIILASTPPKSPSHAFVKFVRDAEYRDSFIRRTVYHNPRLTPDDIKSFADSVGGYDTIDFKREYLAQFLIDDKYAVVPEFADEELQNECIKEWKKPPFFDGYVSMDIGMKDLTVVLFAYFDFRSDKLIIEDEYCYNGQKFNTNILAQSIKEKERKVYWIEETGEQLTPTRVSDNNLMVIKDLYDMYGLQFSPTRKDDADAALNEMRIKIQNKKIIINPRCKTLIRHLKEATWNKKKTSFERSTVNFHYDAVDSLKYLVRNVMWNKNPYPEMPRGYDYYVARNINKIDDPKYNSFNKMLNLKRHGVNKNSMDSFKSIEEILNKKSKKR